MVCRPKEREMAAQVLALNPTPVMGVTETLVARAQAGDPEAFRQLYIQYRGMVARLAYNITGSQQDLEDIIQEIFLQVHRSIQSFHGDSKFSTWLYRLAINVAMQYVRQSKKSSAVKHSIDDFRNLKDDSASPEEIVLELQKRQVLLDALEKISPKKRQVFVLHELQGIEAKEIARILRIPTLTVRTRLFYARKAMYRMLMKDPAFTGGRKGGGTS
jgi:RNA polymerase sigma-70 factor (ECF subfamily)